ncbi:hypothetical protein KCU99_g222, partial [Aureobasidium melanogenum]
MVTQALLITIANNNGISNVRAQQHHHAIGITGGIDAETFILQCHTPNLAGPDACPWRHGFALRKEQSLTSALSPSPKMAVRRTHYAINTPIPSGLRQAFHDDLTPSCWWMQPQQAFLKLYDATEPNPTSFLRYCDAIAAISEHDIDLKKMLIRRVRAQCKDAVIILRHKALHEDARWLDDFASYHARIRTTTAVSPRTQSIEGLKNIYELLYVYAYWYASESKTEQSQEASRDHGSE